MVRRAAPAPARSSLLRCWSASPLVRSALNRPFRRRSWILSTNWYSEGHYQLGHRARQLEQPGPHQLHRQPRDRSRRWQRARFELRRRCARDHRNRRVGELRALFVACLLAPREELHAKSRAIREAAAFGMPGALHQRGPGRYDYRPRLDVLCVCGPGGGARDGGQQVADPGRAEERWVRIHHDRPVTGSASPSELSDVMDDNAIRDDRFARVRRILRCRSLLSRATALVPEPCCSSRSRRAPAPSLRSGHRMLGSRRVRPCS